MIYNRISVAMWRGCKQVSGDGPILDFRMQSAADFISGSVVQICVILQPLMYFVELFTNLLAGYATGSPDPRSNVYVQLSACKCEPRTVVRQLKDCSSLFM